MALDVSRETAGQVRIASEDSRQSVVDVPMFHVKRCKRRVWQPARKAGYVRGKGGLTRLGRSTTSGVRTSQRC
jgi:hypothetical protein